MLPSLQAVPVSVPCATSDGDATAGQDYVATNGTLTWKAGESSGKIITAELTTKNDVYVPADTTFDAALSEVSGGEIGLGDATVKIAGESETPAFVNYSHQAGPGLNLTCGPGRPTSSSP